ncbi:hypothetical protein [Gimesia chilikensis]|uniref:Uncharacterized protein n=1 Tax=Gimesia chilikensis TaxID=2605989 RepID=A0A517PWC2_9PLAN|nr:hypothetical protein [Gimesia chilikensis]QDT23665.1 hypothetical protein HG66A1_54870 [Gimesia chilikensis]
MEKVTLSATIFLVILVAILLVAPNDRQLENQPVKLFELQMYSTELENVHNLRITSDAVLEITYEDEAGHGVVHQFINLKAGNVVLVEDEEFDPEKVLISDARHGGLRVTISKSLNLNLPDQAVNSTLRPRSP